MVNSTEFGERLQKILDFYGISAAELSKQISVNRSTFSHLLSGRNKPSLDFIMKILQKYPEVELYWLLNGKGTFPASATDHSKATSPIPKTTLPIEELSVPKSETPKKIEKIIIFYSDGSFKSYHE